MTGHAEESRRSEQQPDATGAASPTTGTSAPAEPTAGTSAPAEPTAGTADGTATRPRPRSARTARTAPRPRRTRHGISPWVPNQHGAWPMLVAGPVVGIAWAAVLLGVMAADDRAPGLHGTAGTVIVLVAAVVAWFAGYFAFFAAGIWLRAKAPAKRAAALRPTLLYGAVALVGVVVALLLQPHLLWWAIPVAAASAVAVGETWRGTPRSVISGVATVVLCAVTVPALASTGIGAARAVAGGVTWGTGASGPFTTAVVEGLPAAVWVAAVWSLLYNTGTILYVKTMIREKGNRAFLAVSIGYHALMLVAVVATGWVRGVPTAAVVVMALVAAAALARSVLVPRAAARAAARVWTPKAVGRREMPLVLGTLVACLLTALLYGGGFTVVV
ncbi:YwiC-like family protein [Corynebacterium bovis]|uniref:YwiC-like family protein n=2 Tax=Corynebacterium bovis TaxID=36808 RepID=UPI00313991A4